MSLSTAHAKTPAYVDVSTPNPSQPSPRKKRRVDPAVYITAFAIIVLAAALMQVEQRARLATLTYELHNARSRLEQLERIQTQLLVEMDEAKSLSRIDGEARTRLGLVRPQTTEWLVVRNEPEGASQPDMASSGWLDAVFSWYDKVSSGIRAALP